MQQSHLCKNSVIWEQKTTHASNSVRAFKEEDCKDAVSKCRDSDVNLLKQINQVDNNGGSDGMEWNDFDREISSDDLQW